MTKQDPRDVSASGGVTSPLPKERTDMDNATWRDERDTELQRLTDDASALLVDRAVVHVVAVPHDDSCDGTNVLRLTLDDGTVVDITGGYGGYTGNSCDEYVELISIDRLPS